MSGRARAVFVALLAVLLAASAWADEVIYFTNGTSLPIRSHRIESDMISVDLGADARMAFPVYMVDKIESAGRNVFLNPTYHPANQAVGAAAGSGEAAAEDVALPAPDLTVSGAGSVPSRFRSPKQRPDAAGESQYTDIGARTSDRGNIASGRFRAMGNRASRMSGPEDAEKRGLTVQAPSKGRTGLARFSSRTAPAAARPSGTETAETPAPEGTVPETSTDPAPQDDVPPPE